ncbi:MULTISPECIES: YscO family type III secretion system apparatus protein [Pseudomonas syringae group genomosp. 2]|uniref:Type III secretion component protein HrpO n=1 Tax=Pseudomonas amygdali pv. mori TaxID=34065 RepID=A0A0P9VHS2_PSEA0|nr:MULTISPECIES: YscO family type III secretion system apparatus protein [Pseudomonas syringae group genomosp. 2]KPX29857.1 Type III secretion component protein HrpO [Pseudomonas ficuserectae]KPY01334.1 Type III secretion component protein HrpO [Pseudomonas amygdali pv. mori]RMQ36642.1 Type III secretion component protein HrpO [Pseudomonas amygdali pv. mori]RMR42852.1 Type III secretion component protein HrpO [Pseudomonas amygdali pv. mori]RMS31837.1 Type III secretion component protein HrpO [
MDDTLEDDPQRAALEQVIGLLTPLRQHRQASAERAHRHAQVELKSMLDHLSKTRASLDQERDNHKRRREGLSQEHLEKAISLNDIDRWHEKEKHMLDRLACIRQDVQQQQLRVAEQQALLEQKRLQAKASQRAVEKLACMEETLNEEG